MLEAYVDRVDTILKEIQKELIQLRRDFHQHAEPGWMEMRTTSLIAGYLDRLGYQVLIGEEVCLKEARMGVPENDALEMHYQWAKNHGADEKYIDATRNGATGVIGILDCGSGPVTALRFDIDALGVYEKKEGHFPAEHGFASVTPGIMHACGHDGHMTIGLGNKTVTINLVKSV